MSDYLFDKQGEADPEVARLEGLLAPLAYRGVAPRLPARRRSRRTYVVAVAMTAMAAAIAALVIGKPWRPAWLDTERGSVRVAIGSIGSVELLQHARARVVAGGPAPHAVELVRGTLRATIDAPPRQFAVVTPHAVITDLGCSFEVTVDEAGRGQVVVTQGRVAVASGGAPEVVVPAGARVELSEHGAGVPSLPAVEGPSTPTSPSVPPPTSPSVPPPTPPAAEPSQPPPAAAKQPHHAAHTTSKPASAPKPMKAPPAAASPAHGTPHAPKPAPGIKVEHDSLRGLSHSVE